MSAPSETLRALLPAADAFDHLASAGARFALQSSAAFARWSQGLPPVALAFGPASAHEVVEDGELARLVRYPSRSAGPGRPLVVVASLINRYYVLDLLPELSVIGRLCESGFDVYVLDWKAPGARGPELGFGDYVDGAIAGAVTRAGGGKPVALLGYCMGGTLAAMYAARHPSTVQALCLLGTPIDFHASGDLAKWTERERFDADLLMDVYGNMPPSLMQAGFKLMKPGDALGKMMRMHQEAKDEASLRHLVALEAWLEDNIAFPGGVYRAYIRELYQDNALIGGTMRIAGAPVELGRITAPLLNVVALRDHICAPPSSRALMDLTGSTDRRLLEFDTGHIGLTTSKRAHEKLWPEVCAWLSEHTAEARAPRSKRDSA